MASDGRPVGRRYRVRGSRSGAPSSASRGASVVDVDDLVLGDQPIEGLIGPNGAGKTTLMRMIMHSIPLDRGRGLARDARARPR